MNKAAKKLGLEYIGYSQWSGIKLYYFNDKRTKNTLAVKDVKKLKAARDKSRMKFKEK